MSNRALFEIQARANSAERDAFNERCAALAVAGQRLFAKIRPSSKYFGQGVEGELFPVAITPDGEYPVHGGSGGQYRLLDVDLFVNFDDATQPIQINFKS